MTAEDQDAADVRAERVQNTLAIEDLVAANFESNKTMVALVEQVRRETEARDRRLIGLEKSQRQMRFFTQIVCVAVVFLLIIAAVNAWNLAASRDQQQRTQEIARLAAETNQNTLDCIQGTGECGQVNAERQRALLDEVKLYELTGFYCIRNNPSSKDPAAEEFLKCMQRLYPGGPTLDNR